MSEPFDKLIELAQSFRNNERSKIIKTWSKNSPTGATIPTEDLSKEFILEKIREDSVEGISEFIKTAPLSDFPYSHLVQDPASADKGGGDVDKNAAYASFLEKYSKLSRQQIAKKIESDKEAREKYDSSAESLASLTSRHEKIQEEAKKIDPDDRALLELIKEQQDANNKAIAEVRKSMQQHAKNFVTLTDVIDPRKIPQFEKDVNKASLQARTFDEYSATNLLGMTSLLAVSEPSGTHVALNDPGTIRVQTIEGGGNKNSVVSVDGIGTIRCCRIDPSLTDNEIGNAPSRNVPHIKIDSGGFGEFLNLTLSNNAIVDLRDAQNDMYVRGSGGATYVIGPKTNARVIIENSGPRTPAVVSMEAGDKLSLDLEYEDGTINDVPEKRTKLKLSRITNENVEKKLLSVLLQTKLGENAPKNNLVDIDIEMRSPDGGVKTSLPLVRDGKLTGEVGDIEKNLKINFDKILLEQKQQGTSKNR